jgi:hypothetical protein
LDILDWNNNIFYNVKHICLLTIKGDARQMKISPMEALLTLKAGQVFLDKHKEAMNRHKFNYKDFQILQDNYEKLIWELCQKAFIAGKENMSDEIFMEWLKEQSCYEETSK